MLGRVCSKQDAINQEPASQSVGCKASFSNGTPTERKFQILCPTRILFLMILATLS